ncbi:unnamed protein product [Albugo candida]|uniref:Uncharacterized protein n=1 Tax=Albugo candida TaxID=65357 RepID=A0A024GVD9_9STRA|nr:unnamed protein product [Albugo candida]|eukprot:CCI50732.1 unnamed protein product [Albugo candida]
MVLHSYPVGNQEDAQRFIVCRVAAPLHSFIFVVDPGILVYLPSSLSSNSLFILYILLHSQHYKINAILCFRKKHNTHLRTTDCCMKLLTSSTVGNVIIFLPSILTLHVRFREYSCIISCIKLSHGIKNCSSFITCGYICISQLSSEHVAFRAQQNAVADYTIKSNDVALTKMEIFSTPSLLVICDGAKGIFEML